MILDDGDKRFAAVKTWPNSAAQVVVEYDGVEGGAGAGGKSVKSCQKSKNCQTSEKTHRPGKFAKAVDLARFDSHQVCRAQELSQYHFRIDYQPCSPCQAASLELLL